MPLIIEDGSNVVNANSYVGEAEYRAWANARFGASRLTAPADDAAAESLILRAMDYLETLDFVGNKTNETQPLQWPRAWVSIDGYAVEADEIPKELKASLYELTYAEEQGLGMSEVIEREVSSEKVGPISVSYDSGSSSREIVPSISRQLRKIIKGGGGFRVMRI